MGGSAGVSNPTPSPSSGPRPAPSSRRSRPRRVQSAGPRSLTASSANPGTAADQVPDASTEATAEATAEAGPGREWRPGPGCDQYTRATAGVDLNALLQVRSGQSVLLKVCGPSMVGAGISDGALLLVERRSDALPGQIVVAQLADGFTVKRLIRRGAQLQLEAAHPAYPPLPLGDGDGLWGVVRHVIQAF